ncbi:MAG: formimidoylglutamate deiminase [Phycisphaerales bacterium]
MTDRLVIHPALTWTGDRFESGRQIVVEPDGTFGDIGPVEAGATAWPDRAVLPGMVNAHSHAFQRGLRGRGELFRKGAGSFWSWRETMYDLVGAMDEPTFYNLSLNAFTEMLRAGITTVGEFHYLHHDQGGSGYAFDEVVLRAAADAGIRIALLSVFYKTGGIGESLKGGHLRFWTASLDEYWSQLDALTGTLDARTQTLGVAAHSIRAVPLDLLVALHAESRRRGLVFHMHVEEQPAEISDCVAAYDARPMAVLNSRLAIDERFCAVHCTHTAPSDMEAFVAAGGTVCVCPLTEANLGDGIPLLAGMQGRVSLGTDSNLRISFADEMRLLEYAQRLKTESRGVFVDDTGRCGAALWRAATVNGARALGVDAGELRAGAAADFITLDLAAPALAGWTPETLLDSFVFGAGSEVIAEVYVGGRVARLSSR